MIPPTLDESPTQDRQPQRDWQFAQACQSVSQRRTYIETNRSGSGTISEVMSSRAEARSAREIAVQNSSDIVSEGSGGNGFGMNALSPVNCLMDRPDRPAAEIDITFFPIITCEVTDLSYRQSDFAIIT